jgi:hypothetical protein
MRRREFIALIGSAVTVPFVRAPVAGAQEPGRIYRLGVITGALSRVPGQQHNKLHFYAPFCLRLCTFHTRDQTFT